MKKDFKNTIEYPEDPKIPIWRYMSFAKFMDILSTNKLFFSRTDKFFDKYEGYVNQDIYNRVQKIFLDYSNPKEMEKEFHRLVTNIKKMTVINCWNMSYTDSLAMWNSYCPGPEGVAIKSNIDRLKDSLWKYQKDTIHIRPVKYVDEEKEQKLQLNTINLFSFKRLQFETKKELRVIITLMNEPTKDIIEYEGHTSSTMMLPENGKTIPIDFIALIEEIYVSPYASDWFVELVSRLVRLMFDIPIKKSTIKSFPKSGFQT